MGKKEQPAREQNIEALIDYFASGIKDEASHIGIELEHTLVTSDGEAVAYDEEHGQKWLLEKLSDQYTEHAKTPDGDLIGLFRNGESVTLEPAAQVEISAGPFGSLKEAASQINDFENRLASALEGTGVHVLTPGYHPTKRAADLKLIPKKRYAIMNSYLGGISMYGICMMRGSASTQVAIDYTSINDCLRKMRLASACVPVFSLICDNSPVFEAKQRSHQLIRTEIWNKCDPDRCMLVPGVMDAGFSLEDYARYILDTPACVEQQNGKDVLSTRTFGEIFADKVMGKADIEHALSMFFTDVRLKTYIEIRPADAMPPECAVAYAALVKGLFYSEASLRAMDSLFKNVTAEDVKEAKASLMQSGYHGKIYGAPASEIADEIISIAATELSDEERAYVKPLAELVANRTTLADMALNQLK